MWSFPPLQKGWVEFITKLWPIPHFPKKNCDHFHHLKNLCDQFHCLRLWLIPYVLRDFAVQVWFVFFPGQVHVLRFGPGRVLLPVCLAGLEVGDVRGRRRRSLRDAQTLAQAERGWIPPLLFRVTHHTLLQVIIYLTHCSNSTVRMVKMQCMGQPSRCNAGVYFGYFSGNRRSLSFRNIKFWTKSLEFLKKKFLSFGKKLEFSTNPWVVCQPLD